MRLKILTDIEPPFYNFLLGILRRAGISLLMITGEVSSKFSPVKSPTSIHMLRSPISDFLRIMCTSEYMKDHIFDLRGNI